MAPKHKSTKKFRTKSLVIVLAVLSLAIIGTGIGIGISHQKTTQASAPTKPATLTVVATTPGNAGTVSSQAAIRVELSGSLAKSSPLPSVSPAVPGSWERLSATTLEFVQLASFAPGQSVTVTIPGGPTGIKSTSGVHLASSVTTTFSIAPLSTLRVQQLLAQLNYLPVSFTPSNPSPTYALSTATLLGTFSPRWSSMPATLMSQWQPGVDNVVTKGALMEFENVHAMKTDGLAGPTVWAQLLSDVAQGKLNPNPYNYVSVTQTLPETLNLYSNGQVVFTARVNTGIPGATTDIGTFPVYLRYATTTMKGTNPDGSTYNDPGIPWVSYFHGGDALHGFVRSSYGSPQSVGCVEMSFADAGTVWPQTPIGTLVTVQ